MALIEIRFEGQLTPENLGGRLEAANKDMGRYAASPHIDILVDTLGMTGYEGDARNAFVGWFKERKARFRKVGIVSNKLAWHIAINTMALASGVKMKPFDSAAAAKEWLAQP